MACLLTSRIARGRSKFVRTPVPQWQVGSKVTEFNIYRCPYTGSRAVTFSFKEDLIHLQDAIGTPTVSCLRSTLGRIVSTTPCRSARPPIDGSFPLLNNISLVTDLEIEGGCHRPISTFCGCAMAKSEPYRIECIALQMVYLLSTPFYGKAVTLGRGGNDPDQWLTATLGYPT